MTNTPTSKQQDLKNKAIEQLNTGEAEKEQHTWSYAELFKEKDLVQNFLIPDLIPDEEVCALIGIDGVGKTQLMSQLAYCVGTKKKHFLGLNLNVKFGSALIVATEDSKKKFTKAIVKIATNIDPDHNPDEVSVHFTEAGIFDDMEKFMGEIERNLKIRKTDLVIIDALQDVFLLIDGEINSNSHATKILSQFQNLCNKFQCSVIFIHHAAKTAIKGKQDKGEFFLKKDDSQGAGRITQKPRTVLGLTHDTKSATSEGTQYTNYLHALKVNVSSRHYMRHAIKCTFDTSTLLHEQDGTVDIEEFENADRNATDFTPNKKPMAKELDIEQHKRNVTSCFEHDRVLTRREMVGSLQLHYGVGKNKVEAKDGYLNYLLDIGLIINKDGLFQKGGEQDFKLPISTENWDTPAPPDVITPQDDTDPLPDYDTPF